MEVVFRTFLAWANTEKSRGTSLKSLIIFSPIIAYCTALTYNSLGTFVPSQAFHLAFMTFEKNTLNAR